MPPNRPQRRRAPAAKKTVRKPAKRIVPTMNKKTPGQKKLPRPLNAPHTMDKGVKLKKPGRTRSA